MWNVNYERCGMIFLKYIRPQLQVIFIQTRIPPAARSVYNQTYCPRGTALGDDGLVGDNFHLGS